MSGEGSRLPTLTMVESSRWASWLPAVGVLAAALVSALVIWWPTESPLLVAGFIAAGVLGSAMLLGLQRPGTIADQAVAHDIDWSLLRAVADVSGDAVAITNGSGHLVCANEQFVQWFGGLHTPPNVTDDAATVRLLADAGKMAWTAGTSRVAAVTRQGQPCHGVVERIGSSANHLLWRWSCDAPRPSQFADFDGLVSGSIGHAFSDSGVMAVLTTPAGIILQANGAFAVRATGRLDAGDMKGVDFAELLRVDQAGLIRFAREHGQKGSTPLRLIEVTPDRGRTDAPILMLVVDEDGGAAERGIALDYVESLLAALPFGMAMLDRDGQFLFTNSAFISAAGLPSGARPAYPGDLVIVDDVTPLSDAIRRHAGARGGTLDITVCFKSHPEQPVALRLTPVRGMGNAAVLLSVKDEHETGELRQQVAQAQKMQAVGQLAGGIAHDFNNILTAILGGCDLMLLRQTPGDSDYDDVQQIRSNANRAANLTRQLLAFSRQQTLRPQIVNLSDIVADVSHLLKRLIGDTVQLDVQHGRGLGPVRADPVQLEQVIMNLAVNARDALPRGGSLVIETRPATADDLAIKGADVVPPGEYSVIKVTDSGTGIAPEVLPKIFDPFFTTKDVGQGTGLGLATVYGIVKQSGGFIFAQSRLGQGTSFTILLPTYRGSEVVQATTGAQAAGSSPRAMQWGSGTILLVEDEDVVRAVAERSLVRAGYTVLTAAHGEEGAEMFAANPHIDLVISDVMMPQMDGPTMVRQIRRDRPDVPVLFMSGYAEEQLRQTIALANVAFLPKPFSVAQLVEAVAEIRAASDAPAH